MNPTLASLSLSFLGAHGDSPAGGNRSVDPDLTASVRATKDSVPTIGDPRLLFTLPEALNTPDGLAVGPGGRILLSVPNIADNSYPAAILEIRDTSYVPFATELPAEPSTGKAAPMDLAFGPDGNVYYTENQYGDNKNFASRLMRIQLTDDQPGTIETVVDSFGLSNGLAWKDDVLFVTDSQ